MLFLARDPHLRDEGNYDEGNASHLSSRFCLTHIKDHLPLLDRVLFRLESRKGFEVSAAVVKNDLSLDISLRVQL